MPRRRQFKESGGVDTMTTPPPTDEWKDPAWWREGAPHVKDEDIMEAIRDVRRTMAEIDDKSNPFPSTRNYTKRLYIFMVRDRVRKTPEERASERAADQAGRERARKWLLDMVRVCACDLYEKSI